MKKVIIICFCLWLSALYAHAQKPGGDTTLRRATIEVIQAYKPEIRNLTRPELQPELPPIDTSRPDFTYSVPQQTLLYTYRSQPLRPLSLGKDTTRSSFPGYLKLGGGNLSTLYLDAGSAHLKGKDYQSAIHLSHISQQGEIKFQKTAFSALQASADFQSRQHLWQADLSLLRNEYYTYGFDNDIYKYEAEDVRNTYTGGLVSLGVGNIRTPNGLFYKPSVSAGIYSDGRENTERALNLLIPVSYRLDTSLTIGLALAANLAFYDTKLQDITNNILSVQPYAQFVSRGFNARLGLSPTFGRSGNVFLLPDIYVGYKAPSYPFLISAGWKGALQQNSFRELTTINPYLAKEYITAQTRKDEVFVSVSSSLGPHISLGLRGSYWTFNNLPLYLNDTGDTREFYVVYDESVNALSFQAFARYQFAEVLSIGVSGTFYSYTKYTSDRLWHVPTTELKADITYQPARSLTLRAYITMLDGIYGRNINGDEIRLSAILDAGGGVEYRIIPRLSIFGNLTNIFNGNNQRWMGYDAYGFNIYGGLRLRF